MIITNERLKKLIDCYQWPKAVAVTGALGSGKTEWLLNLAAGFRARDEQVTIADADIINPYFCIRQVVDALEERGFDVLTAPGHALWGDMPIVTADVDRALSADGKRVLLDIGGDAEGALALKQYQLRIEQAGYLLILVVNPFRPQTSTVEGIDVMRRRMEAICQLKVGALISNAHLMTETKAEDVYEGCQKVLEASKEMGLPLFYAGVTPRLWDETAALFAEKKVATPLWPMSRHMLLPWEPGAIWATGLAAKNHGQRMLMNHRFNQENTRG